MHFDIFKQIPITQIIRNRKHSMAQGNPGEWSHVCALLLFDILLFLDKYQLQKYKIYKYTVKAIFYWEPRWMAACLCSPPLWVGHRWWRACQALWGEILNNFFLLQIFNLCWLLTNIQFILIAVWSLHFEYWRRSHRCTLCERNRCWYFHQLPITNRLQMFIELIIKFASQLNNIQIIYMIIY